MTTLRVLLSAAPDPGRAEQWALFDAAGRRVRSGRTPPAQWPTADRVEAVLAARAVRIVSLALPPLPAARLAAAVRYALDDQFAAPADEMHVAIGAQRADGRVLALVVSRALLASVAASRPPFVRVLAEPALAAADAGWRWCRSADGHGFVRRDDGSAFPVDGTGDIPPSDLVHALAQAARNGRTPARVIVDADVDDAAIAAAARETGVPFARGTPWQWDAAPAATFGSGVDLLQGDMARVRPAPRRSYARAFTVAGVLVALALGVHIAATLGTWAWLRFDGWRTERALVDVARQAGVADATPDTARVELARRHAEREHAAGRAVADDALPLLARAAPALAALPAGALKRATYSGGAWTLELVPLDATARAALGARLTAAGLSALQATTTDGVRVRIGARA